MRHTNFILKKKKRRKKILTQIFKLESSNRISSQSVNTRLRKQSKEQKIKIYLSERKRERDNKCGSD